MEKESKYKEKIERLLNETFIIMEGDDDTEFTGEYSDDKDSEDIKYGRITGIMKDKRDELADYLKKIFDRGGRAIEKAKYQTGVNRYNLTKGQWGKENEKYYPYRGPIDAQLTQYIKDCAIALREATTETGKIKTSYLNNKLGCKGKIKLEGMSKGYTSEDIWKGKRFIDSIGLSFLYDPSYIKSHKIPYEKFGLEFDNNGGYDLDSLDLNNISDKQCKQYSKGSGANPNVAEASIKESVVDRYLESQYGIKLDTPITFPTENKKLKETLIVNFTSAFKCPAWNECLVKHACYARSGEGFHRNVYNSNERKHFMWLLSENDSTLRDLVYSYLRACVINYELVEKYIPMEGLEEDENIVDIEIDKLPDEIVTRIREGRGVDPKTGREIKKNFIRVKHIRLNENGDFINQNIMEMFDGFAMGFSRIGVQTSAYTCRNLNVSKLSSIIINASNTNIEGASRYFIALPEDEYENLENTFEKTRELPNTEGSMINIPKPYVRNGVTHGLYYKCPCGNKDVMLSTDKNGKSSVNCYHCRICYNKPSDEVLGQLPQGGKIFVFVKAHGTNKGSLDKQNIDKMLRQGQNRLKESVEREIVQQDGTKIIVEIASTSMSQHFTSQGLNECYVNRKRMEFFNKLNMLK